MTTIDELPEMEFVNWDGTGVGTSFDPVTISEGAAGTFDAVATSSDQPNMDLMFGDVEGDDWSYWALEHFESTQVPQDIDISALPEPEPAANSQMYWETPEAPCTHCATGGYQCKRIREGKYRGYCTSCVALRCECSFGPLDNNLTAEAGTTFPANPWPIMGDRPATSILHEDELTAMVTSAPPPHCLFTSENRQSPSKPQTMPKIGARFSRESVKILKNWVVTHSRHPYPTEEEKEGLQKITGLNKTQITNWLANARRRGKIQPTRATSPHVGRGYAQAIDIPQRRGTPGPFESMNPLQRWANSPPENEPASVAAIARAVSASSSNSYSQTSGSGRNSPYVSNYSDDGSSRSLCNQSSASSLGTSHSSGGSFASAFSSKSHGSFGSLPSFVRTRGRRRRRRAPPKRADESLNQPLKTFQCTFCTETFRTKHDWQRHEKSLHLSLERWICSPDGPRFVNPENGLMSCVFCGEANPDDAHTESHNFSGCTERTQEERTFYRKDHLRQHLKLVHNVRFLPWAMDRWRIASPEIRSRCGFCGVVLDSWTIRVDHLAEHFKTGNTMADWKGDWGFEAPVLEMVENSIPPYLIHDERNTPLPYRASTGPPATPTNAYELLKIELQHWISGFTADHGRMPTDAEIQVEACSVIFGAETQLRPNRWETSSWLRDLVVSAEEQARTAAFRPIRNPLDNRVTSLRINGKEDIFEACEFEQQMQDFVKAKQLLGLTAMDHELQVEACRIISRTEEKSSSTSEDIANWMLRLIYASPKWLENFKTRASLPRTEDLEDVNTRSKDPKTIDSTIHNYSRLERELAEYLQEQRSMGIEPGDADLQRQARIIIYDTDDGWNQTAADDKEWLSRFRQRHSPSKTPATISTSSGSPISLRQQSKSSPPNQAAPRDSQYVGPLFDNLPSCRDQPGIHVSINNSSIKTGPFFLNDTNCYRRLAQGLNRFVAATMSANNPNRHVPTDEEIQYQARWLIYDDDDPWNQTAADNFEWLQRFKRDANILPADSGPGLGSNDVTWAPSEGGTGFAPPYVAPNPASTIEPLSSDPTIFLRENAKPFEPSAGAANRFLQSFTRRHPAPAKVFCSRELEDGLTEYVRRELRRTNGVFPTDDALRERARQIMAMQKTSCDDPILLERFKANVRSAATLAEPLASVPEITSLGSAGPLTPGITADLATVTYDEPVLVLSRDMDVDFHFTEAEMNDLLLDVSPDLGGGGGADLNDGMTGIDGTGFRQ
ncbi:uncharacterized protein GGS22DRAFT_153416 [Annulohypoxylon maeteangense]|uniref:uncharacterized protein n=1 Tax=Annulohypoxylon maeteangense TaxID=1927788 RepID=UPI0020079E8C|nr:uncharacterized protein GGS22DRAFT_153416 [Annulohypoxylon maeteangense]KAI0889208.1 hypothetical protein GGS22DRAFT_153416 [Annulohypoxylon maeteangense]